MLAGRLQGRKLVLSDPEMRTVHYHADMALKACAGERVK